MPEPQPMPPPPTPPALALDLLLLIALLGALEGVLVAEFVPVEWIAYYSLRLWLPVWLLACLVYGGPRVSGRGNWIKKHVRLGRSQFVEWGGGAYAAIALVCFAWLEFAQFRELFDWIVGIDWQDDKSAVREFVQSMAHNVTGFFVGSFMNGLYAFVWPAFWKKIFTAGTQWPAVAVAWGMFEAGRWTLLQVGRRQPACDSGSLR